MIMRTRTSKLDTILIIAMAATLIIALAYLCTALMTSTDWYELASVGWVTVAG